MALFAPVYPLESPLEWSGTFPGAVGVPVFPHPGNAPADLLCVTAVNPKPDPSSYICFGFVRKAEGREVLSVVKGQTTCHISLPSLATTEGCVKRKKVVVNSSAASFLF